MIRVETPHDQVNVAKVYEVGQEQIFEYWDELDADERAALLAQIDSIDFQEFGRLVRILQDNGAAPESPGLEGLAPVEMIPLPEGEKARQERSLAIRVGMESLKRGECGVFLVAGGQGTRLRIDGPKGMFPIGPVSEKPLFQLLAEQILAMQRRVKRSIPWFVMTSDSNHETTRNFFHEHSYFGLNPASVVFEPQGMLPVVDKRRGKILLTAKNQIAVSPNGHGGAAAVVHSLRETLEKRGIQYLFYHQVDNPLLTVCDPAFLGFHILSDAQFSSKAVAKTDPDEKIGVFCRVGNTVAVVEYTELEEKERHARDDADRLLYRAGNVAGHVLSVDLFCPDDDDKLFEMPYHLAQKAAIHLRQGKLIEATEANAVKFESFLFDVIPSARNPIVMEVDRAQEFAPVKNFEGQDSPSTCHAALIEKWARWLEEAGVTVPRDSDGRVIGSIEISALHADSLEELKSRLQSQPVEFEDGLYLK